MKHNTSGHQQRLKYPTFKWTEDGSQKYFKAIRRINRAYREMLQIGKVEDAFFNKEKKGLAYMLTCATEKELYKVLRHIRNRYKKEMKTGNGHLQNFNLDAEILPDPLKHGRMPDKPFPTNHDVEVKKQILTFEHYLST